MATKILVPSLGESVQEATVGVWLKKIDDVVEIGEPLLELETDKVTIEVPSPISGKLVEISVSEGEIIAPGGFLGSVSENAGHEPMASKKSDTSIPNHVSKQAKKTEYQMPQSPSAAKLMEESGLSSSDIDGTGKRGQILKSDVVSFVTNNAKSISNKVELSPSEQASISINNYSDKHNSLGEERVKMSRLRQTVAKRLKDAQNTAAILTTYNEVNMSRVISIRSQYKDLFEKKHGIKLGFMGFFTKAVCQALQEIKGINAEINEDYVIYKNYCHIGVAVGTDKGLVVPVLRNADQMSLVEIEKEINRLGKTARSGQLSMQDLQGGTFTISNGGVYGSLLSSPILNPPQSGILGMHKIQERAIVENGQIVARPMMYIALSYDHRIVDGREAVTFLVRIKELLEDPERFILNI